MKHRDKWDTVIHITEMPERRKDKIGQNFIWRDNGWEISKTRGHQTPTHVSQQEKTKKMDF